MTLALYMDEHIESIITEQLAIRGINVLTVQQDGRTRQPDDVILARAYELRRVVVTQDADYFAVATKQTQLVATITELLTFAIFKFPSSGLSTI